MFIRSNERDSSFYVFYVLHNHSNLTELLWKFDNTPSKQCHVCCEREKDNAMCAPSEWIQEIWK